MNHDTEDLENQMLQSLEAMLTRYRKMDELADQILASEQAVARFDGPMLELKNEQVAIQQLAAESQAISERYQRVQQKQSSAIQALTAATQTTIQNLLMKITELERRAQDSCKKMVPQINASVRAVQMKNAYGKYT
jgi:hypothetical protein